jgi:DNA-binding NtrC family response regulator
MSGPALPGRRRVALLASVASVAALGIWLDRGEDARAWLAGAGSLGVALFAARRTSGVGRLLGWGAAIVLASLGSRGGHGDLQAFGAVGAMACLVAASVAIAQIPSAGGIVRPAPRSPAVAVVAVVALWSVALVARLAPAGGPLSWLTEHPRAWAAAVSVASLLVLMAEAEWTLRRRRLELGVVERASAMRALLGTFLAVGLAVGALGRAQVDGLGRAFIAVTSALVVVAALEADAARVARAARRVVLLAIAGGLVAVVGASVAAGAGEDAADARAEGTAEERADLRAWATLATAAVALVVGAGVGALESPLRPSRGVWLDACARACHEASRPEPDDAIREVLVALRGPRGLSSTSSELWTLVPARATRVDTGGYLHDRDAELPDLLVATAQHEPEKTLRADVLDALEVRRPDLRPVSKWLSDRGAWLATVVSGGVDVEGVLVLARGPGSPPPTLDEVRAFKRVADRLAAPCQARATRARLLARAHEADRRAEAADERAERMQHEQTLYAGRDALAATRLARPATVGVYSAGSRLVLEALGRRTSVGAPIAVVAPSGVDPVPHLARAHLAGPRRDAPLVLVDATSAREHDLARWCDPRTSPLALADRGMLVLLDGAALPAEVQRLIACAVAERRVPWDRPDPFDIQLAWTAVLSPGEAAHARLDPALAVRFGDASASPVVLPRLRDRVEDMHAIVTDGLAREGLRVIGRPVGIEHAAYAHLIEYPFPGEDAELAVVLQGLVARCSGDVVRVADVDALRSGAHAPASGRDPPKSRPDRMSGPRSV